MAWENPFEMVSKSILTHCDISFTRPEWELLVFILTLHCAVQAGQDVQSHHSQTLGHAHITSGQVSGQCLYQ